MVPPLWTAFLALVPDTLFGQENGVVGLALLIVIGLQTWTVFNVVSLKGTTKESHTFLFGPDGSTAGGMDQIVRGLQEAHHRHRNELNAVSNALALLAKDVDKVAEHTNLAGKIDHITRILDRRHGPGRRDDDQLDQE